MVSTFLAGRSFGPLDGSQNAPVALVNETIARRFWPNGDAIGQSVSVFPGINPTGEPQRQIVGVVRNVRDGLPLEKEVRPTVYVPLAQMENTQAAQFVRSQPLVWLIRAQSDAGTIAGVAARERET